MYKDKEKKKENSKKYYIKNKEILLEKNKLYYIKNKEILLEKHKLYKKNNYDRLWESNNEWNNSEYGFIMNLYTSARKESKKGRHGKNILVRFEFTKKSWWQHWLSQKEKYGMKCPYSKVEMTHIRGTQRGKTSLKKTPTNISKDQIWPGRGYTVDNLVFCTVKFNSDKKSITPDGCQAVIDVHNEMMNRWMIKINFKSKLDKTDISKLNKDGVSFFAQELNKLKESIGEEGMKQFYQVAYEQSKKERIKNETQ
tara:strand:+ start:1018 stop:1779 length:762 start_codon:yes stop_codon:yes gene_type:complete